MKLKGILRPSEVAEMFEVSEETVLEWREIGMPWIKLGKMILISESGFLRWLKSIEKAKKLQDAPRQEFFGKSIGEVIPPKN